MRVRFEKDGAVFEFERRPLPGPRFRAVCLLALAGLYYGMVVGVAALCGVTGIGVVAFGTILAGLVAKS